MAGSVFLLQALSLVLAQADVPGQAAHCGDSLELVDDIPGDEVNVVVTQLDADVTDALAP